MASVVGSPLGGALSDDFGWRTAILGYAFMSLCGAAVFWALYRPVAVAESTAPMAAVHTGLPQPGAFRSPLVWLLALIVGLGGFGQFTITQFVPSVAGAVFGLDAAAAGIILSTGYLAAIFVNLAVGVLADRFNRLAVLGGIFVLLAAASAAMNVPHEAAFRFATAAVISLGFSAANQLYGLAASYMPRHEAGNAMGVVSLGAGLFGFLGPQLLGVLRDATGSFAAGFYMVVIADVVTLGLIFLLHRLTRRSP
jgi:predicted MFS family arabinose efflux permease